MKDNLGPALAQAGRVADDMARYLGMKHKVSELEGDLLDAAVAKAEGLDDVTHTLVIMRDGTETFVPYGPSTHWAIGGPIIERERMLITPQAGNPPSLQRGGEGSGGWHGRLTSASPGYTGSSIGAEGWGPTPLIAAMRAYVASKLGDEIDLP